MAKKTVTEVFEHYYQAIVSTLPMKNCSFVANLKAKNLLPSNIEDFLETLSTTTEKSAYFLDNIIKPELNNHTFFDKLLTAMMESGYDDMKDMAIRIESELLSVNTNRSAGKNSSCATRFVKGSFDSMTENIVLFLKM